MFPPSNLILNSLLLIEERNLRLIGLILPIFLKIAKVRKRKCRSPLLKMYIIEQGQPSIRVGTIMILKI
jgi:hypothetical protein